MQLNIEGLSAAKCCVNQSLAEKHHTDALWQSWMLAYPGYTLQIKTLFPGWPIMVHDMHMRRLVLISFKANTHFTVPWRTEGCVAPSGWLHIETVYALQTVTNANPVLTESNVQHLRWSRWRHSTKPNHHTRKTPVFVVLASHSRRLSFGFRSRDSSQ